VTVTVTYVTVVFVMLTVC